MNGLHIRISTKIVDICIAFAVAIQSPLILLQQVLVDIVGMNAEETTKYRVVLTAIPMIIAIILGYNRKKKIFIIIYSLFLILLLYNIVVFPQNSEYLLYEAVRFTLPVVIPSCLCLLCLSDMQVFEDVLYYISWITFCLALYYVLGITFGGIMFNGYNMSFSYGLLLPMLSLYSRKNSYSIIASLLLFIFVIALGSRGAAVFFTLYVIVDIILFNRKYLIFIILAIVSIIFLIPLFINKLDELGISSRTLILLLSGDFDQDSGRSEIFDLVINPLMKNPILGIGLWGDRYYIDGFYCHNIILEVCLNFGIVLGSFLILYIFVFFLKTYFRSNAENKMVLLKYLIACVLPLMLSNSYLVAPNFGIFLGVLYSIRNCNVYKQTLKYKKICKDIYL